MEIEKINNLNLTADDFKAIDDILYHTFRKSVGCTTDSAKNTLVALHGIIQDLVQDAFELGLGYVGDDKSFVDFERNILESISKACNIPAKELTKDIPISGSVRNPENNCGVCADYDNYQHLSEAIILLKDHLTKNMVLVLGESVQQKQVKMTVEDKYESASGIFSIPIDVLKRHINKSETNRTGQWS